jgi:hypothetical protein
MANKKVKKSRPTSAATAASTSTSSVNGSGFVLSHLTWHVSRIKSRVRPPSTPTADSPADRPPALVPTPAPVPIQPSTSEMPQHKREVNPKAEAETAKELGNVAFREKRYGDAIDLYSLAIGMDSWTFA